MCVRGVRHACITSWYRYHTYSCNNMKDHKHSFSKYYGGTEEQQDKKEETKPKPNEKEKDSKAPAKRSKIMDEDDDDGCGF